MGLGEEGDMRIIMADKRDSFRRGDLWMTILFSDELGIINASPYEAFFLEWTRTRRSLG